MSTYEPGTLAMICCADGDEFRAVKDDKGWSSLDPGIGWVANRDAVTVRPLFVIDLVAPSATAVKLRKGAELSQTHPFVKRALLDLACVIEKQTPRITEPAVWGVVEAAPYRGAPRRNFIRDEDGYWGNRKSGECLRWDDLIDPTLIREGVES